jgi:hypothetical protein
MILIEHMFDYLRPRVDWTLLFRASGSGPRRTIYVRSWMGQGERWLVVSDGCCAVLAGIGLRADEVGLREEVARVLP